MKNNDFPVGLEKLGFSESPRSYMSPTDTDSEDWKLECLGWFFVTTKTKAEIHQWVQENKIKKPGNAKALLDRINRQRRMIRQRQQDANL